MLKPVLVLTAAAAVLAAILYVLQGTYDLGYSKAQAEGKAALEVLRAEHAQAEADLARAAASDAKAAAQALREQAQRADQAAAHLADQQRQYRQNTDRLTGEIARVNDLYRAALDAPPEPLPACVFTRGFVRVWDEATGAAVPAAEHPGGAAAPSPEARAADQLDAGISRAELLHHHVRYAEQCRSTAEQLNALIHIVQEQR